MWKSMLLPELPSPRASLGLLVLRLVAGAAMASHGWGKMQDPFHWLDKAESPPPAFLQFLAAFSEFGGGLALIIGALTVVASIGLAFTMMEAVRHHVTAGDPFGRWELALLYFAISILFLCVGPGRISVDALVARRLA
ncbi:MAG: DoxX family protein [Archangium sp.]